MNQMLQEHHTASEGAEGATHEQGPPVESSHPVWKGYLRKMRAEYPTGHESVARPISASCVLLCDANPNIDCVRTEGCDHCGFVQVQVHVETNAIHP